MINLLVVAGLCTRHREQNPGRGLLVPRHIKSYFKVLREAVLVFRTRTRAICTTAPLPRCGRRLLVIRD